MAQMMHGAWLPAPEKQKEKGKKGGETERDRKKQKGIEGDDGAMPWRHAVPVRATGIEGAHAGCPLLLSLPSHVVPARSLCRPASAFS